MMSSFSPPPLDELPAPWFTTPVGTIWKLPASALFETPPTTVQKTFLVRRLNASPNALVTGAILRRIANHKHPRIYGPLFWKQTKQGMVVATPMPPGAPLAMHTNLRFTWSEALALWRPLAEVMKKWHLRGSAHGQLTPWSVWLDRETMRLTAVDAGCWSSDALGADWQQADESVFWPPEFKEAVISPIGARQPPSPSADIYCLARLLLYLTLPNESAMQARPNMTGLPAYVIPLLERAIRPRPSRRVPSLDDFLNACGLLPLHDVASRNEPLSTDSLHTMRYGRVSDIETIHSAKYGRGIRFLAHHVDQPSPEQSTTTGAFFYESVDPHLFKSLQWLWEGAEINLLDSRVVRDSAGRSFLTANNSTLAVIEPHWPITVSAALSAQSCMSRVLVEQRKPGPVNEPLIVGNLVHGMLEDLVAAQGDQCFEQILDNRLPRLSYDMLAAGINDTRRASIVANLKQHFEHLQEFIQPRTSDTAQKNTRIDLRGQHAEATRYTTLYGLEGRIDLVIDDDEKGLQIVELKSGKPWETHLSQLRCYTLLWDSFAKRHKMPLSGYLLYSKQGTVQRAPLDNLERERHLLRARNELIAYHRSFVDGTVTYAPPFFMQDPQVCKTCRWQRERCKGQTTVLNLAQNSPHNDTQASISDHWSGLPSELARRALSYYWHFTKLIETERWSENNALGMILQPHRLHERVDNHSAVDDLKIIAIDLNQERITFQADYLQAITIGDRVVAHRGSFDEEHILQGICVSVSTDQMVLKTQSAALAESLPPTGWIVDTLPARLGYRGAHQALYQLLKQRDTSKLTVLLSPESPEAQSLMQPDDETLSSTSKSLPLDASIVLNPSQRHAINAALNAPLGCLIQGPPGTGKSTVIAHLVREYCQRNQTVLLTTLTNSAIDTLLLKLLDAGHTHFLRVGSSSQSPELVHALKAANLDIDEFFSENLARKHRSLKALSHQLDSYLVVAGTAYSTTSASLFKYLQRQRGSMAFDVAIVDEASQLTEPMTLGPLCLARKFVLVGDHRQLPPIVQSELARSEGLALDPDAPFSWASIGACNDVGCSGLDKSLFERMIDRLPFVMLTEQYRMHDHIMTFSNNNYYGGNLSAHPSVAHHQLESTDDGTPSNAMNPIYSADCPVVFVHVDAVDQGRVNPDEAHAIVHAIDVLFQRYSTATLGVVTPYRAQAHLIRKLMQQTAQLAERDIDVDTVEKFQGSERDIIVVSLVKTKWAGDFLADERRLNVTLTRARKKLIVFGHQSCLSEMPLYRQFIEQAETHQLDWNSYSS